MKNLLFAILMAISLVSTAQFSPLDLSPVLWLDASDESSLVLSGNSVLKWNDKSGNGNHAVAPSTTDQPVYKGQGQGIYFDGIDDVLVSSDIKKGSDNTITVFAVVKAATLSGDEKLKKWIVSKGSYTGGAPYGLMQNYGGLHAVVSGTNVKFHNDDMKMHILCQKYTGQAVSGEIDGNEFPYYDIAPSSNDSRVAIGSDENDKYPFNGNICEVMIFQKLLDECEISKINGYLAYKWGETELSEGHPFSGGPVDVCEGSGNLQVDENVLNGTSLGIPDLVNVSGEQAEISNWEISYQLFDGMFAIDDNTGEITVADNTNLDYELATSIPIRLNVETNIGEVEIEFQVLINDLDDGDTPKQTSLLWGEDGEKWDTRGRLPDYSFAGYRSGEADIPVFTNEINVVDQGVVVGDDNSDVAKIQQIINDAPDSAVIFFPAGRYVIDAPVVIERSNIVLKGVFSETDSTIFYLPKSATEYSGSYQSTYSSGDDGYFVFFQGGYDGTKCLITEDVKRGDRTITVDKISGLKAGDVISITGTGDNPQNGELWKELHNNQAEDWDCTLGWSGGNGGPMYHTIERIEGNLITLREPLRINMKASWEMAVQQSANRLFDVGIENIVFDFKYADKMPHLEEPGYNGVMFIHCTDFWARKLVFTNCDNGINFKRSTYGEADNILFNGREGHHGFKFAYCSNNIAHNFDFQNTNKYVHSITFTHKANDNVLYDVKGSMVVSLDFHRNAPFSNLICQVSSKWNNASSGTYCAGPHAGARNVYWNLYGQAGEIRNNEEVWGQYQNSLVSPLSIPEKLSPEREWYENVQNVTPANLYLAQLNKRLTTTADPLFMDDPAIGDRQNWFERDPSRWRVETIGDEKYYSLYFPDFPALSGGKPGEYSIYTTPVTGNYEISAKIISPENLDKNPDADVILIIEYTDDNNYIFGRISSNVSESGIFRVAGGSVTGMASSATVLPDNSEHEMTLQRKDETVSLFLDQIEVASAAMPAGISGGKPGIGSTNDAAFFDNILVRDAVTTVSELAGTETAQPKVYPNPSNGIVNVTMAAENQQAVLYNMNMQALQSDIKERFDISGLPDGIYFLEIKYGDNRLVEKIVKN